MYLTRDTKSSTAINSVKRTFYFILTIQICNNYLIYVNYLLLVKPLEQSN